MKYFHCDRDLIERPEGLLGALSSHGVSLQLDQSESCAIGRLEGESVCILYHPKRFCGNLSVRRFPSLLPLEDPSPATRRFLGTFHQLGITPVSSPAEAEVEYVEAHFDHTPAIRELIDEIRCQQRLVENAVRDTRFEDAARGADERDALLDRLYDACTSP